LGCSLAAAKLLIPVAHVEAGLRSFDRSMPEEINRIVTDHVASFLFTTEQSATENLMREGIPREKIHFVGNSMIDSLQAHVSKAAVARTWERFGYQPKQYGLVTLHRPSNVDDLTVFSGIAGALIEISRELPLLFPVHPRTSARMHEFGLDLASLRLVEPLGYLDFLALMASARIVLTDSGGIQEETTALGVPCVTLRLNTERPITLKCGTNRLAGVSQLDIVAAARAALSGTPKKWILPPLWDGHAAPRIVDKLYGVFNKQVGL
jgi:UDP-N-acetylglucosamine 2-epimerase (non-hydrolysing)